MSDTQFERLLISLGLIIEELGCIAESLERLQSDIDRVVSGSEEDGYTFDVSLVPMEGAD